MEELTPSMTPSKMEELTPSMTPSTVRVTVGCVVAGNVNPFSAVHGEQNDGERVNFPADGMAADLQREGAARKRPFLFWHGGRKAGVGK